MKTKKKNISYGLDVVHLPLERKGGKKKHRMNEKVKLNEWERMKEEIIIIIIWDEKKNIQAESTLRIKRVIIIYEIKMNIYDNFWHILQLSKMKKKKQNEKIK